MRECGQIAYEAYIWFLAEKQDWHFNSWETLGDDEKQAWRTAAYAAIQEGWHGKPPVPQTHRK